MAKKKSSANSEIEALEKRARQAAKKLRDAREAETERRGLGAFRDQVTEITDNHNERVERQTSYDTNDKARTFGFGAFDGALDGTLRWVRIDSVYALEVEVPSADSGRKSTTMLKTVDGPVDVAQSADQVINEFIRVRNAGSAEYVREMQGELIRREDKVNEAKAKRKAKADAKAADTQTGPDFQKVSDLVGTADEDDALSVVDDWGLQSPEIEDEPDPADGTDWGIVNDEDTEDGR